MSFSPEQLRAIQYVYGPVMVLAGPGSGKTTVITQRILYMLRHEGIPPEQILVITFTKAAAVEMEDRFLRLWESSRPPAGMKYGSRRGSSPDISFGTFHSVFFSILREECHFSIKNIISEREKNLILRGLCEHVQRDIVCDADFLRLLESEIAFRKSGGMRAGSGMGRGAPAQKGASSQSVASARLEASARSGALAQKGAAVRPGASAQKGASAQLGAAGFDTVYNGYVRALRERGLLDFEDMLTETRKLFWERPAVLSKWQRRYRFLLVDEFQDASPVQYEIVRMLAAPENNLFIVGDDDQSIYGFRGAHPSLMLNFGKDYPASQRILLGENFRSREEIVSFSTAIIENNRQRFRKKIHAANGPGGNIFFHNTENTMREYELVAAMLKKEMASGMDPDKIGVLFRANSIVRPLVSELSRRGIPYVMKDGIPNPYEHFAAKDLAAYVRLSIGVGTRADFLRVMNKPLRYISRESVQDKRTNFQMLEEYYRPRPDTLRRIRIMREELNTVRSLATAAALTYIRKKIGYEGYLREFAREKNADWSRLSELLEEIGEEALRIPDKASWLRYIEEYRENLQKVNEEGKKGHGVRLMTYHGAKGLEFDSVHLIDAVEGVTPWRQAETEDELEEERRAFYVAVTRAKLRLHVYVTKTRFSKKCAPSRFVLEGGGQSLL